MSTGKDKRAFGDDDNFQNRKIGLRGIIWHTEISGMANVDCSRQERGSAEVSQR